MKNLVFYCTVFLGMFRIDIQNFECVSDHFSYDSLVVVIQSEYINLYYIKRIKNLAQKFILGSM